jgi:hypothetical protein
VKEGEYILYSSYILYSYVKTEQKKSVEIFLKMEVEGMRENDAGGES